MTTKPDDQGRFHKGEKVEAAVDLPGVPEGTAGKVIIEDGVRRFRYWVRFENGVAMGSLTPEKLRRPEHHHLAL